MKQQHWLQNQCRATQSLMPRMRSSTTILKLQLYFVHSVKWIELRRIKSCSVSWIMSQSTPSRQGRSTCSSASSSLKWLITLNGGMIMQKVSGTLSAASSTLKESLRRCSGSVKDVIDISLCSVNQSTCPGRRMDGSGHRESQMIYLRVAHSFMFNNHVESRHGRYYIYSGTLRGKVQDIPEVSEEARARILRIVNVIHG